MGSKGQAAAPDFFASIVSAVSKKWSINNKT
jgi:hypothetical protein